MLTNDDHEALTMAFGRSTRSPQHLTFLVAPIIEQIVGRHVAAALNEAADGLDHKHAICPNARGCEYCVIYTHAARIVRAQIKP